MGKAESEDGRKHIHGSVSILIAAQQLNYFDFRIVAWTLPQGRHCGKFCRLNMVFVFLNTYYFGVPHGEHLSVWVRYIPWLMCFCQ